MYTDIFQSHRHVDTRPCLDAFQRWLDDECIYVTSHNKLRDLMHKNDKLVFEWLLER